MLDEVGLMEEPLLHLLMVGYEVDVYEWRGEDYLHHQTKEDEYAWAWGLFERNELMTRWDIWEITLLYISSHAISSRIFV